MSAFSLLIFLKLFPKFLHQNTERSATNQLFGVIGESSYYIINFVDSSPETPNSPIY